jgi:cystathionine beta-lyase
MFITHDFDTLIERRSSGCVKWNLYDADVLPLWVADMDFAAPEPVMRALRRRVEHGVFGYGGFHHGKDPLGLKETICQRTSSRYGWKVSPDQVMFLPGLVCGLNVVCRAIGEPGDGVLVNTPIYPPFLSAPINQGRPLETAGLAIRREMTGGREHLRYEMDSDAIVHVIRPQTRLLLLCNPHNPVGRAFSRDELTQLANLCLERDLIICADEIHSDLLLDGNRHLPIASLAPEVAQRTITLLAPSKTFNLPGLYFSILIIQNPQLRQLVERARSGIVPDVNVLGYVAAAAAYTQCQEWLDALLHYLTANRNFAADYIARQMPAIRATLPEATYLLWLDCRNAGIQGNPYQFFLEEARVALNDGVAFGSGGEGFVRLNMGCRRATLAQALERMRDALARIDNTSG